MNTIIDITFKENFAVLEYLDSNNEVSFYNDLDAKLKKMLLLSVASYFENEITEMVSGYVYRKSSGNEIVTSFVQKKAINRQYHTFFDWNAKNCNHFLGLFGEEFKKEISQEIKDNELDDSVKAFLELGQLRNSLVHQNAATFVIEKTSSEIYEQYKLSIKFIDFLNEKLS